MLRPRSCSGPSGRDRRSRGSRKALEQAEEAIALWLSTAKKLRRAIPKPVGSIQFAEGINVGNCASWNGTNWESTGPGISVSAASLAFHDDGSGDALYVGGPFHQAGGILAQGLARWDSVSWSAVVDAGNISSLDAMAEHDDGSGRALYLGGTFWRSANTIFPVARWNGSSLDEVGDLDGSVACLAVHGNGSGSALYAGGHMLIGPTPSSVSRWDGTAWTSVGHGSSSFFDAVILALAEFDHGTGPALYVAGEFEQIGGVQASNIAKWDGSVWSALGAGLDGRVRALAVHDDGSAPALYAGGDFTSTGGAPATRLARWNGTQWSQVGTGVGVGTVEALHSFDNGSGARLILGGTFSSAGGIATGPIARWDGSAFQALGMPLGSESCFALTTFDAGSGRGSELFAGGDFTSVAGVALNNVARWNGAGWSDLAGGVVNSWGDGWVRALRPADLGQGSELWVGGWFAAAGPSYASNLARWDGCGETGRTLCFGDGSGSVCPCGNYSVLGAREGCATNVGVGGRLRASGRPSLAVDTLELAGSQLNAGGALYFQGTSSTSGGAGVSFGDGLRCTGGTNARLAIVASSSGASSYPQAGDAPVAVQGGVSQPGVRVYQVWFRDAAAFCTPSAFNMTNAVEIVWGL